VALSPVVTNVAPVAAGRRSRRRTRYAAGGWSGLFGAFLVLAVCLAAIGAPGIAPHDPVEQYADGLSVQGAPLPPGPRFPLGTDDLGRDVLSRLLYGARSSLAFAVAASAMVTALGMLFGVTAGYYGGWFDELLMRFTDAMFAFPFLLLVIFLLSVLRHPGIGTLILVVGCTFWPGTARVARGETLVARSRAFVEAERALGAADLRILIRHVAPNVTAPVIVLTALRIGYLVVVESGLAYLGLGVPPPAPTWGAMIHAGQAYFAVAPWLILTPGGALTATVLGFNLLGDALNAVLNPRRGAGLA
jgi:peptide/nickel transport system permease protein